MTSKEALKVLECKTQPKESLVYEPIVAMALSVLKQDLEVLEILKTIVKRKDAISTALSIEDGRAKTKIIITLDTLNDKEILCNEKVKNWLERKE